LMHVAAHCFPRRSRRPVICVHHGNGFWHELERVLESLGNEVISVQAATGDPNDVDRWVPRPIGDGEFYLGQIGSFRSNFTILGLPLPGVDGRFARLLHEALVRHNTSGHPTVLLEWPVASVPPHLRGVVSSLYLRALKQDYRALRVRNRTLARWLSGAKVLRVQAPDGTDVVLHRDDAPVQREDCEFTDDQRVFQLPGGEVFFVPASGKSNGRLVAALGGTDRTVVVEDGVARFPDVPGLPRRAALSEFGLGTNASAAPSRSLNIGEKADGTCHFGFGDDRELGGSRTDGFHFDLVVKNPTVSIVREA